MSQHFFFVVVYLPPISSLLDLDLVTVSEDNVTILQPTNKSHPKTLFTNSKLKSCRKSLFLDIPWQIILCWFFSWHDIFPFFSNSQTMTNDEHEYLLFSCKSIHSGWKYPLHSYFVFLQGIGTISNVFSSLHIKTLLFSWKKFNSVSMSGSNFSLEETFLSSCFTG